MQNLENIQLRLLSESNSPEILQLTQQLNPNISESMLAERQSEMFASSNYVCFGIYEKEEFLGVSSGWITTRLYSGKQLEIDNVIISPEQQSKGLGKIFINLMEEWAIKNKCQTLELNTYVGNGRSHKFYFNLGYQILGFHFQKSL